MRVQAKMKRTEQLKISKINQNDQKSKTENDQNFKKKFEKSKKNAK